MYTKEFILDEVNTLRDEIGHDKVKIFILLKKIFKFFSSGFDYFQ